ncbi:MAG: GGDEF domain-containing protein [Undibacterium sp.]|nr:GGDEF domain-containing protein [Undibacterium sp.]
MQKNIKYSIGFRLGLLLASFGLVAMSIVAYTSYANSRSALLKAAQRDLLTATQVLGRNFQASIDEISADTLLLARLPASPAVANAALSPRPATEDAVDRERKMLADIFSGMLEVHPEYVQIRLIGTANHALELVRVDRDDHRISLIPVSDLQEKSHYPYVFETMQLARGQVHVSDITINHEVGAHSGLDKPSVRVAAPVFGLDGKVAGLIVINLDLNRLFTRLKSDLPSAYQLYLSNHWGDYLIHPDPAQTFGFDRGRRVYIQDRFKAVNTLINGRTASVVTDIEIQKSRQDDLVSAFVRLPFGGGLKKNFVVLGLSQPVVNVVSEIDKLGWSMVQVILILGALAVVLAALVSRAVTGPLRMMVDAVRLFSKKQVMSELPSGRRDEIGLLARSLNHMQETIVENMRELNESRHTLKHLAQHDSLTGLPNRALFDDRLRQAASQAQRDNTRMALLFVDLDEFKEINDTYGHHIGDLLLTAAAERMAACVRHADTVGRLGGDEFVVLLPYIDVEKDAVLVAEKICNALHIPLDLDGRTLLISASIGIAIYPEHGKDELTLSRSADAAMYRAKEEGGNCVKVFEAAG